MTINWFHEIFVKSANFWSFNTHSMFSFHVKTWCNDKKFSYHFNIVLIRICFCREKVLNLDPNSLNTLSSLHRGKKHKEDGVFFQRWFNFSMIFGSLTLKESFKNFKLFFLYLLLLNSCWITETRRVQNFSVWNDIW